MRCLQCRSCPGPIFLNMGFPTPHAPPASPYTPQPECENKSFGVVIAGPWEPECRVPGSGDSIADESLGLGAFSYPEHKNTKTRHLANTSTLIFRTGLGVH